MSALGVAISLAGCAAPTTGHYHFELASQGPLPAVWSVRSLPRHGRIDILAQAGEDEAPSRGAHVSLRLSDSEGPFTLAALDMDDPACHGSYSFAIESSRQRTSSDTQYFQRQLPWGAPLKVRLEWWPDGRLAIDIAEVGKLELTGRGRPRALELRLFAGNLVVSDLNVEDLGNL